MIWGRSRGLNHYAKLDRLLAPRVAGVGRSEGAAKPALNGNTELPLPKQHVADSRVGFINHQTHGQLMHYIWWLVITVIAIVVLETDRFLP